MKRSDLIRKLQEIDAPDDVDVITIRGKSDQEYKIFDQCFIEGIMDVVAVKKYSPGHAEPVVDVIEIVLDSFKLPEEYL